MAHQSSIFVYNKDLNKFQIDSEISFHFFTTHPPCGDASIFNLDEVGSSKPVTKKRKISENIDEIGEILDTNITGGKLITNDNIDHMAQTIGEIRTKPGRGIATKSVSCSDKLSKWNIVGIQGALLHSILEYPIYLASVTICGPCDIEATERAVWKRWIGKTCQPPEGFKLQKPLVHRSKIVFEYSKNSQRYPSPSSIVWCKVEHR